MRCCDVSAAVGIFARNEDQHVLEHDHDAPGDGPLLGADQATALAGGCQFRDIDGDLGGADADT